MSEESPSYNSEKESQTNEDSALEIRLDGSWAQIESMMKLPGARAFFSELSLNGHQYNINVTMRQDNGQYKQFVV